MPDYTILDKEELPPLDIAWPIEYDVLVSGFSLDERVARVFDQVRASERWWLIQPQYAFLDDELPTNGSIFKHEDRDEGTYLNRFFSSCVALAPELRICVDISGLMRPHILYLMRLLFLRGVNRFDILYSEPQQYAEGADTKFVGGAVTVRQVQGYEGVHLPQTEADLLILSAGYDYEQMVAVANRKEQARIMQLFGLPSLAPDMYQESRLRARGAEEALGATPNSPILVAPASDPFVTASVVQETVRRETELQGLTNLYLCPVGSKPQALGFGLYYLTEWLDDAASVIFPFSERYEKTTTYGVKSVWRYTVERLA